MHDRDTVQAFTEAAESFLPTVLKRSAIISAP